MFITAKDYFINYKLSPNYTGTNNTEYAENFMPYLTFASQIPNVLFNWMNVFVNLGGDLTKRVVWSLIIEILIFLVTVILAMIDSSAWPSEFFWITMSSVVVLNMFGGIFQNTVYGMAAKLPPKYTGAVVLGSNISGTFATIISILSGSIWSSYRKAAIYYFITAMFVILLCFDTYFAMPLNKFFRYHEMKSEKEQEKRPGQIVANARPPYWTIFKKSFPQLFNVFIIFFVTLSVFPTVHSDIKSISNEPFFGFVPVKMFTPITCFLTFNVFAMLGSLTTSWIQWPSPKYLVWPVLLRLLFIPLFLFCNYHPLNVERKLPVYINNDYLYWIIAVLMSYSSGYLSSLAMMYAPRAQTNTLHQIKAGMMAAAMLISGIFAGIMFSFMAPIFVQLQMPL
ncbi:hypothetical protein PVAND_001657 [Polypedilum vanderplanki]|uniref:Equilibrative nucleoside transporter n=1 Tax=Polypedilum vanderplanki TaxID=319348 RepID=A0A9J6BPW8_POLVA|nr:hypothetical protein PVAND_001657 [Polypedilum vanderplanki]